jgi:hypothetical protein
MLPCAAGPTADSRLVPFDNNIAQRNVAPVPGHNTPGMGGQGGSGMGEFEKAFQRRRFQVKNPYDRTVRIELVAELPDFLTRRGWRAAFLQPSVTTFSLPPKASREVCFTLTGGQNFTASEVRDTNTRQTIRVLSFADGLLTGGMSYHIDPDMEKAVVERPVGEPAYKVRDVCLNRWSLYLLILILILLVIILILLLWRL